MTNKSVNPMSKLVYFIDCWGAKADRFKPTLNMHSEVIRTLYGLPDNYGNVPVHRSEVLMTVFMDGHTGQLTEDDLRYGYRETHYATWWTH